jgi:hypothetical protein
MKKENFEWIISSIEKRVTAEKFVKELKDKSPDELKYFGELTYLMLDNGNSISEKELLLYKKEIFELFISQNNISNEDKIVLAVQIASTHEKLLGYIKTKLTSICKGDEESILFLMNQIRSIDEITNLNARAKLHELADRLKNQIIGKNRKSITGGVATRIKMGYSKGKRVSMLE